jgi:hypothetical protein
MSTKNLHSLTNELLTSYGNTARNVIQACRVGNARITRALDRRWATAVGNMGAQLSAEVRGNALAAEQKVSAYYTKGITLGTDGAELAISQVLALAGKGMTRVAANASRFEKASGVRTLHTLAAAAVPAAVAVGRVAAKLEAQSGQLLRSIAGAQPKAKRAVAKRTAASKPRAAVKPVKAPQAAKALKAVKTVKSVATPEADVTAE